MDQYQRAVLATNQGAAARPWGISQADWEAQQEEKRYAEYYDPIRQYALSQINGEGVPSLQDMQTSAQMGIGRQYSNANASTAAQMAARGMAGSGMQARSAQNLRRGEALDRFGAMSGAESQRNSMLAANKGEGNRLLLDLGDRGMKRQSAQQIAKETDNIRSM